MSETPSATEGYLSILLVMPHLCAKSTNPSMPTCFNIYKAALLMDSASAVFIGTCSAYLMGWSASYGCAIPGNSWAVVDTLSQIEKPLSTANVYKMGFMVDPTCRLVLLFTWSYWKKLWSMPPTHAFTSPVTGSIAIKPACKNSFMYLIESIGLMVVSLTRCLFHAKTFIFTGTFIIDIALASLMSWLRKFW